MCICVGGGSGGWGRGSFNQSSASAMRKKDAYTPLLQLEGLGVGGWGEGGGQMRDWKQLMLGPVNREGHIRAKQKTEG